MNRPGDRVGPFELTELIAARPLANLWKADRADGAGREPRSVVVRIAHHTMDSRAMSELRKEYDALRGIDDPRVRKAHGFYAGVGALALEFVEGVSLRSVIEQAAAAGRELDLPSVVEVGVELVSALRVVHDAGVVHGRVCADSVRMRADGCVVLTDFAMPVERLSVVPPELKSGHVALASTDEWLVGALLVHLVTGEPLLGGSVGDPADGRRDLRPWISTVSARSAALGRVLARMLARDARDRYGDEGILLRELLATLRSLEGMPDREGLARRARAARAANPPPLIAPPTPKLNPPPTRREVQLRPHPSGSSRLDLAPTFPPENDHPPRATGFDRPQPTEIISRADPFDTPQSTVVEVRQAPRAPEAPPSASYVLPSASSAVLAAPSPALAPVAVPPLRLAPSPATPPLSVPPRPHDAVATPPPIAEHRGARVPIRLHDPGDSPPTELVAPPDPTPGPPRTRPPLAHSWTPSGPELIPAVHEDDTDLPDPGLRARSAEPLAPDEDPAPPRLIPDWAAAFALVCLLAIGLWAVASRFF